MSGSRKMNNIEYNINQIAAECGIDLIGVVNPKIYQAHTAAIFDNCKNQSLAFFDGSLQERFDYTREWADTKSIISFALSYNTKVDFNGNSNKIRIARVSWGQDYHEVLYNYAEQFMHRFNSIYPCSYHIGVDSELLLDKVCAYCAGIGFYGKNGLIVNPIYGSYIFLGHILVDIEIPSTAEIMDNQCGTCFKCIQSCNHNGYVDGKFVYQNCISYKTQMGEQYSDSHYIYGCDICQAVCPFNKTACFSKHTEFVPNRKLIEFDLETFLDSLSTENQYTSCSCSWVGEDILKKNAINLLNN